MLAAAPRGPVAREPRGRQGGAGGARPKVPGLRARSKLFCDPSLSEPFRVQSPPPQNQNRRSRRQRRGGGLASRRFKPSGPMRARAEGFRRSAVAPPPRRATERGPGLQAPRSDRHAWAGPRFGPGPAGEGLRPHFEPGPVIHRSARPVLHRCARLGVGRGVLGDLEHEPGALPHLLAPGGGGGGEKGVNRV
jgi:hypothetical protein